MENAPELEIRYECHDSGHAWGSAFGRWLQGGYSLPKEYIPQSPPQISRSRAKKKRGIRTSWLAVYRNVVSVASTIEVEAGVPGGEGC